MHCHEIIKLWILCTCQSEGVLMCAVAQKITEAMAANMQQKLPFIWCLRIRTNKHFVKITSNVLRSETGQNLLVNYGLWPVLERPACCQVGHVEVSIHQWMCQWMYKLRRSGVQCAKWSHTKDWKESIETLRIDKRAWNVRDRFTIIDLMTSSAK